MTAEYMLREAGDYSAERFTHDGDCCPPPPVPLVAVAALDLLAALLSVAGVVALAHLTGRFRRAAQNCRGLAG